MDKDAAGRCDSILGDSDPLTGFQTGAAILGLQRMNNNMLEQLKRTEVETKPIDDSGGVAELKTSASSIQRTVRALQQRLQR